MTTFVLFKFLYFDIEVDVKVLKPALGVSIIKNSFWDNLHFKDLFGTKCVE